MDELLAGRIYVNIHTSANAGGEIRGNVQVPAFFKALLSGDKSVPPVTTSAVGTGAALLFGNERELDFALNVAGLTPTAAHFHGGSATETGGVLRTIDLINDNADSAWSGDDSQSLTDSLITELLLGNIYMNVHTSANPGGEIRSQVDREDGNLFFAFIDGENQLPSNSSISTGFGVLTLDSARTQVEYDITLSQLSADSLTSAHIHNAGALLSGGVVKTLDFVDGHASGVWSIADGTQPLTSDLVEELLSGRLYVNVHTNAFPAGEIRGQVVTIEGFNAQLSGSQSVPAVTSSGSGTFTSLFFYADSGAELEYNITVEGLTITAAHFHAGAAGVAGGVIKTITFDGNSAEGIWTANDAQPLTDDIVDMIRSGGVYVNIHTSANPGGEIRGQLLPGIIDVSTDNMNNSPFVANPIVDVEANEDFGSISVALLNDVFDDSDLPNDSLRYSVTVSTGVITAAVAGDRLWLFSVRDLSGMAEVVVTATDDSSASVSDTFMVTINPLQNEDRITGAILTGDNSVPPVTTSATGTLTGVLTNNWTEFHYSITIEGLTPTAAHFHNGAFDGTGGVVKTLDFSNGMTISGVWSSTDGAQPFTTEMLDELLAGRIYVNIHTSANAGGEIRGNIQIPGFFKAMLNGDKSVPAVTSPGVGTGGFLLFGYERELIYVLNVAGLTPTAAHFHGGSATGTGGVLKTIDLVDGSVDDEWLGDDAQPLTDSLITELLLGNIYVNIHTAANPGGEIRSQVEREDAAWFAASSRFECCRINSDRRSFSWGKRYRDGRRAQNYRFS